jgi:glycosyltransferase involved in cell wall biosynthesis
MQLMRLASGLAARSHHVEVFAYNGGSALDRDLEDAGVRVHAVDTSSRTSKLRAARAWLTDYRPDLVHGIMKRASSLAVLASFGIPGLRVVTTDMSTATFVPNSLTLRLSLLVFMLADGVVTQTEVNKRNLVALAPWLRKKVVVVRNGVDTERFSPLPVRSAAAAPFTFSAVGTVYAVKNPEAVVRAIKALLDRGVRDFRVDWYGRLGLDADTEHRPDINPAVRLAADLGVDTHITFHGQTPHVERVLQCSDALLHASVQEGFPNAVVEGMACGLPVVVSRVSDLPLVVQEARNGYVFDERDAGAIASAMEQMMATTVRERHEMGIRSRKLAVEWFGLERFIDDFEQLYRRICREPT